MKRQFLLLLIGTILTGQAIAKEGDSIRPYVNLLSKFDDNFYKLDSDVDPQNSGLKNSKRSDILTSLSAGLNIDLDYSNQNFFINTQVSDNRFANNPQFDNKSANYNGIWNWQIGRKFSGQFGYKYDKSIASFVDNQALAVQGSSKINRQVYAVGNWLVHPSWRTGVRLSGSKLDYIKTTNDLSNQENKSFQVNLDYLTLKGSSFGFRLNNSQTRFPARNYQAGSLVENQYNLTTYLATSDWKISAKSRIQGQFGWESLKNKNLSERDFSDWSFNVAHLWSLSSKLSAKTKIWNEVSPSSSLLATYERSRGISLSSSWSVTPKSTFMASASRETKDLEGDPGFILQSSSVSDRYINATVTWDYQATDNLNLTLNYQRSLRDSSLQNRDYTSNSIFSAIKAIW